MKNIGLIFSVAGLITNFIGVVMMFKANPKINVPFTLPGSTDDLKQINDNTKNNLLFRRGMLVLSIGFFLQLIGLVIPAV